jgi:hypothetical protein
MTMSCCPFSLLTLTLTLAAVAIPIIDISVLSYVPYAWEQYEYEKVAIDFAIQKIEEANLLPGYKLVFDYVLDTCRVDGKAQFRYIHEFVLTPPENLNTFLIFGPSCPLSALFVVNMNTASSLNIPMIDPRSFSLPFFESELTVAMYDGDNFKGLTDAAVANHFGWNRVGFVESESIGITADQVNKVCLRQRELFSPFC